MKYFNGEYIKRKNCLFNLVCSDRSDGKTFYIKSDILYQFKYHHRIGIFVRRWKSEMTEILYANFFNEVLLKKEPQGISKEDLETYRTWEFIYKRDGIKVRTNKKSEWEYICFFMPLTMSGKKKSIFNDYTQQLKYIYFDEYVPLDGRYIPNEMNLLLELYKSVDRERDETMVICFGNRITPFVPFLDYFNIQLSLIGEKLKSYNDGTVGVQVYISKENREEHSKSKFAKLVKNTQYETYDKGGVLSGYEVRYARKTDNSTLFANYYTDLGKGSIYYDEEYFYVCNRFNTIGEVIVDKIYNINRKTINVKTGMIAKNFRRIYYEDRLYFEDEKAFYSFQNILSKCCI